MTVQGHEDDNATLRSQRPRACSHCMVYQALTSQPNPYFLAVLVG